MNDHERKLELNSTDFSIFSQYFEVITKNVNYRERKTRQKRTPIGVYFSFVSCFTTLISTLLHFTLSIPPKGVLADKNCSSLYTNFPRSSL